MSDKEIHVGDQVEITADISVLGLITVHAGARGECIAVHGTTAVVKVGGLLGIVVDVDLTLDILIKVG